MIHSSTVLAQLPVIEKGQVGTDSLLSIEPAPITNRFFIILENSEKQAVEDIALFGTEGFEVIWYLHDQKAVTYTSATDEEILNAYKMRDYFWKDDYRGKKRKHFVLNTEELATIFHFPGRVAGTPTLGRVLSKKGAPPSDLPS